MFRQVLLSPGEIKGGQRSPRDQTVGFRRNRGAVLGFARLPLLPPLVESSEAQASRQELWIQGDSLLQTLLGCWKLSRLFLQNAESQIRHRFTLRIGILGSEFNGLAEVLLRTGGLPRLHACYATQEIGLRSGWCVFDPLGDAFLQKIHISFLTG